MKTLTLILLVLAMGACADDEISSSTTDAAVPLDAATEVGNSVDAGPDAPPIADSSTTCKAGDFCPTALPGAPYVNGIFAVSTTRAVAVTKDGKILLWDGTAWSTIAQGYASLTSIWGIDADHFLIAEDQSWSLVRLTFSGATIALAEEPLPFDSACAPAAISISGVSATDLYAAGYCRIIDFSTFTVGYKGVVFRSATADAGAGRAWSVVYSAGGPNLEATALGAVTEVSPGVALVGGWRSRAEMNPVPLTLKTPGSGGDPTQPGTTTFVLTVKGSVVTKQDLAPSFGMCVQSIWASPTMDSVFLGGVCTAVDQSDISDSTTKYTTIAHRDAATWTAVVRQAYATLFDLPGTLLGFGTADVYAAGSYLTHWDGAAFQLVPTAISGSPLGSRVSGLHGIATNDLWMVGDRFALHRTP